MNENLTEARRVIENQFLDIVQDIFLPSEEKLRIILKDKSFVDIRISQKAKNRFDFHWERRHIDKTFFRFDNFPDTRFKKLKTFPHHLHFKKENKVIESKFRKSFPFILIDFMEFVRNQMNK